MKNRNITAALLVSLSVLAAATGASFVYAEDNMELFGVLVAPPPCAINNDETVTVDFGDRVGVKKVASGIYRKTVDVTLTCEQPNLPWELMLSARGAAVDFDPDNATLMTPEHKDLGVKLLLDGSPFELGKAVKINDHTLPLIEALLVQREGSQLSEGPFTAQATLRVEYQ